MIYRLYFSLVLVLALALPSFAQLPSESASLPVPDRSPFEPVEYEVVDIRVEGAETEVSRLYVLQNIGLQVGQRITVPGDEVISESIRQLYQVGIFSDIQILVDRTVEDGAFLVVKVQEEPRLGEFSITGVGRGQRDEIRKKIPVQRGRAVRPGDVERTVQVIKDHMAGRGFRAATVDVQRGYTPEGRVNLTFNVIRGPRVRIADIRIHGNEEFSDGRIRGQMKNTREQSWWRFWRRSRFDEDKYREDLQNIIDFYNQRGYYDARIVEDTVYTTPARPGEAPDIVVELAIEEGKQYHIRNVVWEGNTEYTNRQLTQALGFALGDVYNSQRLERNLYGNPQSTDVASLYLNRGYMRFNVLPTIVEVPGDSLDLYFEVHEGDVYEFGNINIVGNTKTKDHVIRRELRTLPGTTFSRDAIQRSLRELAQLNYFDPEQMIPDTRVDDERRVVDLTYRLEETGSDQLEFSGGWGGGALGVLLQTRVTFNNFSVQNMFNADAWRPLPSGDGQQLSLGVQVGGRTFQSYSLSFQEPWFRGRPNPIGFSVSHSRYDYSRQNRLFGISPDGTSPRGEQFSTTSAHVSYGHRLSWPDDFFRTNTAIGYRLYNVGGDRGFAGLPAGVSQEMTVRQSIGRNSFDNPLFPSVGSSMNLSVEVAPPLSGFIQYHKWRLNTSWAVPVQGRLSLGVTADYGYLGSLTGDRVDFQRFLIGGTPLQAQYGYYGRDLVFMRGYPIEAVSPVRDGLAVGGTILNKYSAELRLLAVQSPQFQLAPYLFVDAANTWYDFRDYNPSQLYRSAGVGARIFLPIVGMLELSYGYNFDEFLPRGGDNGMRRWRFQFSLGQGFGF